MVENAMMVNYHHTGKSTQNNELGMREMQAKVYEKRNSQYLLVKAPPASGKSRALMFVALDKLINQGLKKVIIAVPERSIGRSFKDTELKKYGFYADWKIDPEFDLTANEFGSNESKVNSFIDFLNSRDSKILICTHATFRYAYDKVQDDNIFDNTLIAIDEFHHVSAENSSVLGNALKNIIHNSNAHIIAMTGSYFRGDSAPILTEKDERLFDKVSYSYYDQLDGYKYLKSFGIDYKFYTGKYTDALEEAMDTDKKMIIHIPNVNSTESTKDKYEEVGLIEDKIGKYIDKDPETGIDYIKRKDGKVLKVADLVNEDGREKVQEYLRNISSVDDLDIIIALGMAKEGFDWPWAEYALTIGYRGSLTEIVQIIGRVTRDSENKTHAQFVNLISKPDVDDDDVEIAVNSIIKAITASLLMEQVLAPELKFKPKSSDGKDKSETNSDNVIMVKGLKEASTKRVQDIIENDLSDLKAAILQDTSVQKAIAANVDPQVINQSLIPKVIFEQNPDLSSEEVEEIRQYVVTDSVVRQGQIISDEKENNNMLLKFADKLVNVNDLDINLIDRINPFQKAYEIISHNIDGHTLRILQRTIDATKLKFTDEELIILYPKIKEFIAQNNRLPEKNSNNELEVRYAYALATLKNMKERRDRKINE